MWKRLRQKFQSLNPDFDDREALDVAEAIASLLVYTAQIDDSYDNAERQKVIELLEGHQWGSSLSAEELVSRGEMHCAEAVGFGEFIRSLNAGLEDDERESLIGMMWHVIASDGLLDEYEASMVRRVAALLGVSDVASGRLKRSVMGF